MMRPLTRREAIVAFGTVAGAAVAGAVASSANALPLPAPPGPFPGIPAIPFSPIGIHSPPLQPWVDQLAVPPRRQSGGQLSMVAGNHKFHRDLPATRVWGYDQAYLGPTLIAHSHVTANLTVNNALGTHPLGVHVDTTLHGATDRDQTDPRSNIHLHGGVTPASSDGHPYHTVRNGGSINYAYPHRQEAMTLWYHDHAIGITRLNVHAGLAGMYWVRDQYDTGEPGNPLGLPTGEFEIPLVIQDKIFRPDGVMVPLLWFFLPTNANQNGNFGDVPCVNGTAWPRHDVKRGVYRYRIVNGSNSRIYRLGLSNNLRIWVIGNDQGLLDAPVAVNEASISPGERLDILIDFRGVAPGTRIELRNTHLASPGDAAFLMQAMPTIMQFVVGPQAGFTGAIPKRLRGGPGLPARIPAPVRPDRVRPMTLMTLFDEERLEKVTAVMNSLNNLRFHTDDVEMIPSGSVEQWDLINSTLVEHPIHIHLAKFRILGRQPFAGSAWFAANPPPLEEGVRWNPSADDFVIGGMEAPEPYERGWKDTVLCPVGFITRILVYWPSHDEMGFDPDEPFAVAEPIPTGGHDMSAMGGTTPAALEHDHSDPAVVESVPIDSEQMAQDSMDQGPIADDSTRMGMETHSPNQAQGYVWHCHILDHEDHDMMLPMRVL